MDPFETVEHIGRQHLGDGISSKRGLIDKLKVYQINIVSYTK